MQPPNAREQDAIICQDCNAALEPDMFFGTMECPGCGYSIDWDDAVDLVSEED